MHALAIGPFVFALGLVALVVGWIVANLTAWLLKRRGHPDAGTPLVVLAVAALVAARAAFVAGAWHAYAMAPWGVLDVRDGGFAWPIGVAVLVVGALAWMWRRPRLRLPLAASVAVGLAGWGAVALAAAAMGAPAQPPLPAYALRSLDGKTVTLASLEGKPLVVNVWATWCGPCRSEMPMLVAASHRMREVRFVFVDHGESAATVRGYLQRAGLDPARVLLDADGELMRRYRLPGCPATLFVTPRGNVAEVHLGALTAASLQLQLRRALGVAAG